MLYIALELGYLNEEKFKETSELSIEISKIISGFVKTL